MAEWQYQIHRMEIEPDGNVDRQLEAALAEYGTKGWELVEILQPENSVSAYRLIFKAAKPLD
jgi:hypothetical protein